MVSASRRVLMVFSTHPAIGTPKCASNISGVFAAITDTVSPRPSPAEVSAEARRRMHVADAEEQVLARIVQLDRRWHTRGVGEMNVADKGGEHTCLLDQVETAQHGTLLRVADIEASDDGRMINLS